MVRICEAGQDEECFEHGAEEQWPRVRDLVTSPSPERRQLYGSEAGEEDESFEQGTEEEWPRARDLVTSPSPSTDEECAEQGAGEERPRASSSRMRTSSGTW